MCLLPVEVICYLIMTRVSVLIDVLRQDKIKLTIAILWIGVLMALLT